MSSARKQIKIISLGEVITPNVMKTIQAFTDLIEKKRGTQLETNNSISTVIQQNMHLINNFKLGTLDEKEFTEQIINALKKVTTIELSIDEFNNAWNAMNPSFDQFQALLKQAIEYNKQPNQQVIFISFSNPKDIRNITNELEKNQQQYKVVNDQLVEIGGIELHTTYAVKKNKAELIESIIKRLNSKSLSPLANSMRNTLNLDQPIESEPVDIKYIRCINDVKDPILKADTDKKNQEVEKKTEEFLVETILWLKHQQTLSDALHNRLATSTMIPVSKL